MSEHPRHAPADISTPAQDAAAARRGDMAYFSHGLVNEIDPQKWGAAWARFAAASPSGVAGCARAASLWFGAAILAGYNAGFVAATKGGKP